MSSAAVMDFPYPDETPGADFKNNGGKYLRNLTEPNKVILNEIAAWVQMDGIDLKNLNGPFLDASLLLLRYLRANNFDVKKTKKHILKVIEWRKAQGVDELMTMSPEEILGCKVSELVEHFPHWHLGSDKTGRPLLFKQQGEFDMKAIKALAGGNFDKVFRYHIWEQELISRVCYEQSLRSRTIIETITVVLDVKGMTFSSLSSDFRAMMSAMIKMDQDMYPETLGRILIVNAPNVFPMIWGVMKPWFDPITAAKVKILGADYAKKIQDAIGAENLPANYHGTRPALTKAMHPYAEAMGMVGARGSTEGGNVLSLSSGMGSLKISAAEASCSTPVTVFASTASVSTAGADSGSASPAPDATDAAPAEEAAPAAIPGKKPREFIY